MKTKRNLIIATVLCIIISSIAQWYLFFTGISDTDFLVLQILTYVTDGLLLLAVLFVIGFILLQKGVIEQQKIKKSAIVVTAIFVLSGIGLTGYGYFTYYNLYTPETQLENPDTAVAELFPYHNISEDMNADLEVSHNLFEDHIGIYCNGLSKSSEFMAYRVDYFESLSPLMNINYATERSTKTPFTDPFDIDVEAEGKTMSVKGKEVIIYVDNGNYAVLISGFNRTIYASLTGRNESITEKEFAEEIVNQFELLKDVVDSGRFLDVD